ncbi:response regulator [Pseudomonas helleri]|nr:response regulator [Pseudomonas helleri]MQT78615.1 response regulator [Pseudomonas helleri]MQU15901.1 response regulator [Pseudomonas helleri]
MSPRICVADDHPVVVMGIRMALSNSRYASSITAEAVSTDELIQRLKQQHCDILITDFSMPNGEFPDGMVLLKHIRSHFVTLKIIVMTMLNNPLILSQILKSGVHGLFDKHQPLEGIINAITRVDKGKTYISDTYSSLLVSPLRG